MRRFFYSGQERLQNPAPSNIRKGLRSVPPIDKDLAKTCPPFGHVTRDGNVDVVNIGVHGGFVNRADFEEWLADLMKNQPDRKGRRVFSELFVFQMYL
jgi:hypothetical protein